MRLPRGQRVVWLLGTVSLLLIGVGIVWVGILPGGTDRSNPTENVLPPRLQLAMLKPTDRRPAVPHVPPMPTADREYLWQVEHHGNILNQLGFADLSRALSRADEPRREVFADIFHGRVPEHTKDVSLETPFAEVVRRRSDGPAGLELDRSGFIGRLLEFRRLFTRTPNVKLSLMALAPVAREDMNGLWKGGCLLRMFDGGGAEGPRKGPILHMHYQVARPEAATISLLRGAASIRRRSFRARSLTDPVRSCARSPSRAGSSPADCMTTGMTTKQIRSPRHPGSDRRRVPRRLRSRRPGRYARDRHRLSCPVPRLSRREFVDVTLSRPEAEFGLGQLDLDGPDEDLALADFDGDGWEDVVWGPLVLSQSRKARDFQRRRKVTSACRSRCGGTYWPTMTGTA